MKTTISINGEVFARNITGIERVAIETIRNLDELLEEDKKRGVELPFSFLLVLPSNAKCDLELKSIKMVYLPYPAVFFPKWTQWHYQKFVIKNKVLSLDFANTAPFFRVGFAYIHDIYIKLFPNDYRASMHDRLVSLYARLMYKRIVKKAPLIFAVSNYTKKTIEKAYKVDANKIKVVYSGYKEEKESKIDESIYKTYPILLEKEFYFSLGSLSKRKNIKWIVEHARAYPNELFVVSGKSLDRSGKSDRSNKEGKESKKLGAEGEGGKEGLPSNVIFTGYLTDAQVHSLFTHCKAFIFPSYFEGFGIPPLEALQYGAKVIIANIPALKEIYGEAAYYIESGDYKTNLDELLKGRVSSHKSVLERFTLKNSARQLYGYIKEYFANCTI